MRKSRRRAIRGGSRRCCRREADMARSTGAVPRHRKKKKYFRAARGYFGGRSKLWRIAKNAVERGWVYSYRDRKNRKREFRRLWIARINAAVRAHEPEINYSRFMNGMRVGGVDENRKGRSDLAEGDTGGTGAT